MTFFIRDLGIPGFGICRGPGTNPLKLLRETLSLLLIRHKEKLLLNGIF
jgi:hypothetical protein